MQNGNFWCAIIGSYMGLEICETDDTLQGRSAF